MKSRTFLAGIIGSMLFGIVLPVFPQVVENQNGNEQNVPQQEKKRRGIIPTIPRTRLRGGGPWRGGDGAIEGLKSVKIVTI